MRALLRDSEPRADEIRLAFVRASRLALVGLLAGPALVGLASVAGIPLRAVVDPAFWVCALAGFGSAGWFAGRSLGVGPRREAALAGAFLAVGALVVPAVRGLQGLTGREPIMVVLAAVLPTFVAAFVLAGVFAAKVLGVRQLRWRGIATCSAGGLFGGLFAVLPFCWAWLRVDVAGRMFVVMALTVAGFLGCLIVPFHLVGLALDDARGRT